MFKILISAMLVLGLSVPAQALTDVDGTAGNFFYRYKSGLPERPSEPVDDWASKTVHARFIGGVDMLFSEILPVKPEWEDDNWQVDEGLLPSGITFNAQTRTFEGRPDVVQSGTTVILYGYDTNGTRVAKANVTFDIRQLPANSVKVDLYAHTSKYFSNEIPLPSDVAIVKWEETELPPGGVDYNGRYVQGTPVTEGQWPILNLGYEYGNPQPVFAYYGTITVEKGPSFPTIADQLKPVGGMFNAAIWDSWPVPTIKRPVGDPAMVRYYMEKDTGQVLPGSIRSTGTEFVRTVSGRVENYYEQARVRFKAIDSNGAEGYSNWFQIGTVGPVGVCTPGTEKPTIELNGFVGESFFRSGYPVRTANDASVKKFSLLSGSLPGKLSLDADTGLITGTPDKEEKQLGVFIAVNFPNNPLAQQVVCGPYDFMIAPADVFLDATGGKDDYRKGETLSVKITPSGGLITPYSVELLPTSKLPSTVGYDSSSGMLTGSLSEAGVYYAQFKLTNSNGLVKTAYVSFEVHDPLKIDPIDSEYSIARLDTETLFKFTYDTAAVIGTAVWDIVGGPLPEGIRLSGGNLEVVGGTLVPEGRYGPFRIKLTDSTGEFTRTDEFFIKVTPREPLVKNSTIQPRFGVNTKSSVTPFSVTQTPMAASLYKLNYDLIGSNQLPAELAFDPNSGAIAGTPVEKEVIKGFTVKVTEQSPDNLSATSDGFDVTIDDPPPIGVVTADYTFKGNNDGPLMTSRALTSFLSDVQKRLVGGLTAVQFKSMSPAIAGLSIDQAKGVIEGNPKAEYIGPLTIEFVDGANRPGTLKFNVAIYPFPKITSAGNYELPRLADAKDYAIKFTPNTGFYSTIKWAMAPGSDALPLGLKLTQNGEIVGSTDVPVDTLKTIKVQATNTANSVTVEGTFVLKIVKRVDAYFEFPATKFMVYLDQDGNVVKRDTLMASSYLKGSLVKPLIYSFGPSAAPDWMTINGVNGVFGGKPPAIGDYTVPFAVKDDENVDVFGTAVVRATLSGNPTMAPGDQEPVLRMGQTFKTSAQVVANVVRPFTWKPSAAMPGTFSLNLITGEVTGRYDQSGSYSFKVDIEDTHERKFSGGGYTFKFSVRNGLRLIAPVEVIDGKQYSANEPISVTFDAPINQIDEVKYVVTGDIPGTPYVKSVDKVTGLARYTRYDMAGNSLGAVDQMTGEQIEDTLYRLAPDHLIFDPETLTFSGIPSRSGAFNMKLEAWDTHGDKYINSADALRISHNSAEQEFSVNVAPADDLEVSMPTTEDTLFEYTSQSTLRASVINHAYGRGVTWQKVAGSLPMNVVAGNGNTVQTFRGYPEQQGEFPGIVYKATDLAGRSVDTPAAKLTVMPRQTFALTSNKQSPVQIVVNDEDAGVTITPVNAAYGAVVGLGNWVVTGDTNLPPGVSMTINPNSVSFSGVPTKLGTYAGIKVRATDTLGATATYDLTFNVVASPDKIILNVYDIKTKVGYPIVMEPPFASQMLSTDNTYGKLRFYSDDLPTGMMLDADTGLIAGVIDNAQKLTFDVYVTDETQRVTSEALEVDVMPNLRVLVPEQVRVEPGAVMDQTVATDFAMGKVTYEKGAGNWPAGFAVDRDTGRIYSATSGGRVTANLGNYSGLTIVATDTLNTATFGSLVDTQTSNPFTIVVATAGSYLELKPATLPDGEKRTKVYSFDFSPHLLKQNVDDSEIVWALLGTSSMGWKLPPGLTLKNGVLSGTPTAEGVYTFGVRATKQSQASITTTVAYTLDIKLPSIEMELGDHSFKVYKRDELNDFDMKSLISGLKNIKLEDIRFYKTTVAPSATTPGVLMDNTGKWSGNWAKVGTYVFEVEARFIDGNEDLRKKKQYSITVTGNDYSFREISSGISLTCGIDTKDKALCWGGGYGLANGSVTSVLLPTPTSLPDMETISSGNNFGCGVSKQGQLYCWGLNSYGQVGNGTKDLTLSPTPVSLPGFATAVSAGSQHACALVGTRDLYCWGRNSYGQLGDGTKTDSTTPVLALSSNEDIISFDVDGHATCVALANGVGRCVGLNNYRQLGTNNTVAAANWTNMTVVSGIRKIQMDTMTTCVLTNSGSVQCFGSNSDYALASSTSMTISGTPRTPLGLESGVVDLTFSYRSGCGVKGDGTAFCWGSGNLYKLGNGGVSDIGTPRKVESVMNIGAVSIGGNHGCSIATDGKAECWGYNSSGQLGNGTTDTKIKPALVE